MAQAVHLNNKGFTLIEVLVAMLVLLLGLIGSLLGVMTALNYNLENAIRNEAMTIAQERVENLRNTNAANLDDIIDDMPTSVQVQRQLRKANRIFQLTTDINPKETGKDLYQVSAVVSWTSKAKTRTYSLNTIMRPPK